MDEVLAKRFKSGDKLAFKKIYEEHSGQALRLARIVTKSDMYAADAVQEAFLRAYIHRGKYDPKKHFGMWLNKIVVNECRRLMSKDRRQNDISERTAEAMPKMYRDAHSVEEYGELYQALETLPEDQRVPLVMKYCLGYSEQDIAGVLNLPKSTVKSRLFHARRKMRTEIAAYAKRGVL